MLCSSATVLALSNMVSEESNKKIKLRRCVALCWQNNTVLTDSISIGDEKISCKQYTILGGSPGGIEGRRYTVLCRDSINRRTQLFQGLLNLDKMRSSLCFYNHWQWPGYTIHQTVIC